ncbi:AAA family ATPase [Moraxellaceae bacterium AER2_44_116]|nr:AAA family ATPase [Moraxellaceae bacterium]TQC96038.1 AAA family ATPase [Moraxellaceae bacterium AER2_44_116]
MRIDKISVENFRLFEKREFSFHPQFNLIVGVNGSGKSSLLRALTISLGSLVSCLAVDSPVQGWLINDDDILTKITIHDGEQISADKVTPIILKILAKSDFYLHGSLENVLNEYVYWGKKHSSKVNSEKQHSTWPFLHGNWPMELHFSAPLIVLYGCNRLWLPKPNKKLHENAMTAKYSRRDGYKDWASAQADSNQLVEWLLKQNIIAFQEGKESLGWRVLNKALKNCFESFVKLSFMAKEGDLVVHDIDDKGNPRRKLFKHMSDGQRCMIGLIGDMVRRAVLLNPQLGDEILEKTAGVVLIDELDLHLHPTWQRRIIDDLRNTFPKVQFICTTHSPFLIQSLRSENELLALGNKKPFEYINQSLEDIVENVQGIDLPQKSKRYLDMMATAENYYTKLHEGLKSSDIELKSLRNELDELTIPFSDDPAFVALLKFERESVLAKQGKNNAPN